MVIPFKVNLYLFRYQLITFKKIYKMVVGRACKSDFKMCKYLYSHPFDL